MKYIIDDNELEDLCSGLYVKDDFLKSRKPVTEIASGVVEYINKSFRAWWQIGDTPLFKIGKKFGGMNVYDGKPIKIFILEGEK